MSVKRIENILPSEVRDGTGVTRKILISPDEAPNFAMRCFTIQPDGEMPRHTNTVEHEQYVINGRGRICIGEEEFEVSRGSIVLIPAGIPHWYRNIGDEPFEFLCMVPNKPDTITLL